MTTKLLERNPAVRRMTEKILSGPGFPADKLIALAAAHLIVLGSPRNPYRKGTPDHSDYEKALVIVLTKSPYLATVAPQPLPKRTIKKNARRKKTRP
jgi:hypothetical protein